MYFAHLFVTLNSVLRYLRSEKSNFFCFFAHLFVPLAFGLNYSRSEIKIKIYFVFRLLIRNFAHDFNKHVDRFGLLATTEKNAKRKDLLGTGTTGL